MKTAAQRATQGEGPGQTSCGRRTGSRGGKSSRTEEGQQRRESEKTGEKREETGEEEMEAAEGWPGGKGPEEPGLAGQTRPSGRTAGRRDRRGGGEEPRPHAHSWFVPGAGRCSHLGSPAATLDPARTSTSALAVRPLGPAREGGRVPTLPPAVPPLGGARLGPPAGSRLRKDPHTVEPPPPPQGRTGTGLPGAVRAPHSERPVPRLPLGALAAEDSEASGSHRHRRAQPAASGSGADLWGVRDPRDPGGPAESTPGPRPQRPALLPSPQSSSSAHLC